MYSHEPLIHSLARKLIDMHWILRILREIARRFQVHRWESARRSNRNGQLDPSAPHRITKNSSIANNIRQSNWESIDLGNKKETNAKRKREMWNFSGSHYWRDVGSWPVLTLTCLFFSLYRLLISTVFHPSDRLFSRGNGYVFLWPNASFYALRPERMRRPDITMPPLTRANNDVVKSIPTR